MKRERSDSRKQPKRRGGAASKAKKAPRAGQKRSTRAAQASSRPGPKKGAKSKAGARAEAAAAKKKAAAPRKPAAPARKATSRAVQAEARPARPPASTRKVAPPRVVQQPPAPARPPASRAKAAKPVSEKVLKPSPVKVAPAAPRAPRTARSAKARPAAAPRKPRSSPPAGGEADFADEQRIESSKYTTGEQQQEQPRRVFEEERFIFPETYGRNRVRLLVKDPQWLFAHWDVDPAVLSGLRSELGERAAALSRLTLKVSDPEHGGGAVIHLPEGARSWYLRADRVRRAYTAELGLTLPDGSYRMLARSNQVRTPQGGASGRRAGRKARYVGPRRTVEAGAAEPQYLDAPEQARAADGAPGRTRDGIGPWKPALLEAGPRGARGTSGGEAAAVAKGGASDVHRR
jgi:hypothetical protein